MKKYNIVLADPPWPYKSGFLKRNWAKKYPTMSEKDIYNLPIQKITAENCVLFLWVTFPKLLTGIETISKWGFVYKSCAFVWVKKNKKANTFFWGMGHWTRQNAECCLIATKGRPQRVKKNVHQIIYEEVREHSRKPDCVRKRIVDLCSDLPRIELFARKPKDLFNESYQGWDVWGNEVESDIEL